jgi:tetratricopeptide (TPR) repeat protein
LITAILYDEPESLPENIPLEIKEIVTISLQKERENRFQSVREIYNKLEKVLINLRKHEINQQLASHNINFSLLKQTVTISETVKATKLTQNDNKSVETEIKTSLPANSTTNENLKSSGSRHRNFFENQLIESSNQPDNSVNKIIFSVGAGVILLTGIIAFLTFPNLLTTGNLNSTTKTNSVINASQASDPAIGIAYNSKSSNSKANTKEYFFLGEDCFLQRDYDCAIENYTKAIKLNPKSANAYNNRGISYLNKNEYFLAIDDFTKAVEINPNNIIFYQNRVFAYEKVNDVAQVQRDRQIIQRLQKTK